MQYKRCYASSAVLEWAFAAAVCAGVWGVGVFFLKYGYLPSPFYHFKNDTFMDWYNPAFWAHNRGAYNVAHSFYTPLSFDFLNLLTRAECYHRSSLEARACDVSGHFVISLFLVINFGLAWLSFRKERGDVALQRALTITLGASMLYGWERGNLILPCFTAFVLAYGGLVRSPWWRAFLAGVVVNFKPYLLIMPASNAIRRDWVGCFLSCVACLTVYVTSFLVFGAGNPFELARNAVSFMMAPADHRYGIFEFTTTYDSLLGVLDSSVPLRLYLGGDIVTASRVLLPIVMIIGSVGATLCLLAGFLRPHAITAARTAALGLTLMYVFGSPGAYGLVFLLFLVFLEPWHGAGSIIALIGAYLWCIPWDYNLAPIMREPNFSFLAGHPVGVELSLTLGELLRPGLVLMMQYGLVTASLADLKTKSGAMPISSLARYLRLRRQKDRRSPCF